MTVLKMAKICFVLLILWSLVYVMDGQTLTGPTHGKVVVCYIASWATYRPGGGKFDLEDLDPSLCTHLIYSFAGLDENTLSIKSLDAWQDLEKDYGKGGYKRLVNLKSKYPHLKVTIAIGGWNEGSEKYSKMAANPESRAKFIKSVMYFLDLYKFDGLDLDWEYPTQRGGNIEDKANYVSLVKELKDAFEPQGYILTAALGAGLNTMQHAYDLIKLSRYLDFIHMMCYDYHGTWDGKVGANAPLRGAPQDVLNVEYTIKYMLSQGVSPYKMVLGLPIYGRTFILKNADVKEIEFNETEVKASGFPGPWTKENGFMGYNEICMETTNNSSKWTHHWHVQSATPYLRDGERVVSYDNPRSIANKIKLAMDYGLGGLMVWSIDTDDFKGDCRPESPEVTYTDFLQRYNKIVDDPVLKEAVKTLNPPTAHRYAKHSYYTVHNDKLHLSLPEPHISNYPLMVTINDATALALEEKRVMDAMDKITKENEIGEKKPDSGSSAVRSLFGAALISFFLTFGFL